MRRSRRPKRSGTALRLLSLKKLRELAPPQDRDVPALATPPRPSFVRYSYYATTLDELRDKCGPHGDAAVQEAVWAAIATWLMNDPEAGCLTNPNRVASTAVTLVQISDRARLDYPSGIAGTPHDDRLPAMSPDVQAEARLVATETMADWERAGRPGITPERIKQIHQFVAACTQAPRPQEIAA